MILIEGLSHFLTNFLQNLPSCRTALRLYDTMLNFVENLLEHEREPMNDQDMTKTDYDPDRSLVLIEGLSHFLTNFLQNLASCQTSFKLV
jgi:adenosyl cobinamide kinase/adenosyl cobinamide phosphate guanylyltransferase